MTEESASGTERPDGWPEMFPASTPNCTHQYQWDTADGVYRCIYCDETRDEPRAETDGGGESTDDTERSPISDISCPACGSAVFELKAVDEWANGDLSIYCYCAECGNATGKMWDRTVDNRITRGDSA